MKKFSIKASLAAGLSFRLERLSEQLVVETVPIDPVQAVRANLRIVKHIEDANKDFMDATKEVMDKKIAEHAKLSKVWTKDSEGKTEEEKNKLKNELNVEFAKIAAEIQKESKAKPDEMVDVLLSDDDYEKILKPVFKKTVGTWDTDGSGSGQRIFIEVADAIESVIES